ncbi:hypothetical protein SDC9_119045 [bioreactor metagenome]|uniref:Uncharacterized protein n=1 Tax=bioreactor metagenome TaxID=1076179 RepID=A0A645C337_9ZZZZ
MRRLATQFQRHRHELARCRLGDAAAAFGAAGERHHAHARVLHQRCTHLLAGTRQHVQQTGRQARFLRDLGQQQARRRRDFRWLQDHGIACGQRRGHLLCLHGHRRVPWRDGGDDAIGLVHRHRQIVAARRRHLGTRGLAHRCVIAERGRRALHLRLAFAPDLAVLDHLQARQLFAAALHAVGNLRQDGRARRGQHVAPLLVARRIVGHLHGDVGRLRARSRDLVVGLARRRIHRHQGRNTSVAIHRLAADPHFLEGSVCHAW